MTASTSEPSSSTSSSLTKIPSSSKYDIKNKQKRNARERKRVDMVNQGFQDLQKRIQKSPGTKAKMSKVETLKEAARYIQQLQETLGMMPMAVDFPTPEQSPIYPQPMMMAHTPSPTYISPYYPAPQMTSLKYEITSQYYSSQESSSSASSTASNSGDHSSYYSQGENF
ncbi:hypothetical protein GCK72_005660 [Caenorhabditis remanei]|uniref:BHLH domain-containing protein n=1 Tax=Caenorhabditis remanei TaxID=31234 RepID=A0A6A5HFH2_CAERE|nr:hypothetical protein GCK72_005660 [Caenorhabditis remanei]KAF1765707.1 hypothetical protein GCK72_005660 [Caenorhabditis remanei]